MILAGSYLGSVKKQYIWLYRFFCTRFICVRDVLFKRQHRQKGLRDERLHAWLPLLYPQLGSKARATRQHARDPQHNRFRPCPSARSRRERFGIQRWQLLRARKRRGPPRLLAQSPWGPPLGQSTSWRPRWSLACKCAHPTKAFRGRGIHCCLMFTWPRGDAQAVSRGHDGRVLLHLWRWPPIESFRAPLQATATSLFEQEVLVRRQEIGESPFRRLWSLGATSPRTCPRKETHCPKGRPQARAFPLWDARLSGEPSSRRGGYPMAPRGVLCGRRLRQAEPHWFRGRHTVLASVRPTIAATESKDIRHWHLI